MIENKLGQKNFMFQEILAIRWLMLLAIIGWGTMSSLTAQDMPQVIHDDDGHVFEIDLYTDKVPNARQMAETESGILFVGSRGEGKLYAVLKDAEDVFVFAEKLEVPSGLALLNGDLYVAAHEKILRYEDIEETYRFSPQPDIVTDELPSNGIRFHGWKYMSVGPDDFLYVNVGAPCNVCLEEDERFASIVRINPSNGDMEVYAHGVRNSVGSSWHPETNKMWFSDNGRDWMGDDIPPEEINVVDEPGAHYGFPFIHGDKILDPEFGEQADDEVTYVTPQVNIQAHSAVLGIDFYDKKHFPASYKNALFLAEHGSWNRSSPVGYQVSVVRVKDEILEYKPFISIWLIRDKIVLGRPADVLVARDGSLYISDDHFGKIYRVTYQGKLEE